jgi:hypothetical protein
MHVWVAGSAASRPQASRTVYVGMPTAGDGVELSNHFGNGTPRHFRADTATAMCLRFVAAGERAELAVAGPLDVDRVLALLALQDPDLALGHRRTLRQAAEMGAHQGWGDPPAQELFQGLALSLREQRAADSTLVATRAMEKARTLLVAALRPELAPGLRALRRSAALIDRGEVRRRAYGPRFAHYEVPIALSGPSALHVPSAGEPFSDACLVWPQARARLDREKVVLLSLGARGGWLHEVWCPGYSLYDTPDSWRPPGIEGDGSFAHAPLSAALQRLQAMEMGEGLWTRAERLVPGLRGFPTAAGFTRGDQLAASTVHPEQVAQVLAAAF